MFIKSSTRVIKDKKYTSHYLVESYRDKKDGKVKHHNISNLSKLPEKELILLKKSLAGENLSANNILKSDKFQVITTKQFGNVAVMSKIFDDTFTKIIDKRYCNPIKAIVINKIFEPKSKNALHNWLREVDLNFKITNRNDLYNCLDYLEDHQISIEQKLNSKNKNLKLLLYDITSTYFDGKGAENICKHGYSRDHRSDRVQVNIGLVCDQDGMPVCTEIIAGNITDKQTVQDKIDALKNRFNIKNVTFIFDRGMKSETNLEHIINSGFEYITCLSHAQLKNKALENKNIQQSIFDKSNLAQFEIEENNIKKKFVLCHNPYKENNDKKTRIKLIEKTEANLLKISKLKRKHTDMEIQNKVSKKINHHSCEKYLSYEIIDGKLSYARKTEVIENDEKYDGFYMVESSDIKTDGKELQTNYKSLQLVERAFNDVKNLIEIRPVFHYTEKRIKGHIFSCFMSYYILHVFRKKVEDLLLKYTLDELFTELKMIQKTYLKIDSVLIEKLSELNEVQDILLKKFSIPTF
jgi:transposase